MNEATGRPACQQGVGMSSSSTARAAQPARDTQAEPPRTFFDFANLIRRARRNADMSQRDLAAAIGVSPSTIARAERDGGTVTLPVLMAALAQGGIELVATDGTGEEVYIMRPDALRDHAHRQLPAHLDAWVRSRFEGDARPSPPGSRPKPLVRYARRDYRDQRRDRELDRLLYHPGPEDIAIAKRRDEEKRPIPTHLLRPPSPQIAECTCSDECVQRAMACPWSCPCQCEAVATAG